MDWWYTVQSKSGVINMSVMACHRYCCGNIMCDYLSERFGYICYECMSELKKINYDAHGPETAVDVIDKFMNTMKSESGSSDWADIVDSEFTSNFGG